MTENCVFITFVYKQNKIKEQKSKQNVKSSSVVQRDIKYKKVVTKSFCYFYYTFIYRNTSVAGRIRMRIIINTTQQTDYMKTAKKSFYSLTGSFYGFTLQVVIYGAKICFDIAISNKIRFYV